MPVGSFWHTVPHVPSFQPLIPIHVFKTATKVTKTRHGVQTMRLNCCACDLGAQISSHKSWIHPRVSGYKSAQRYAYRMSYRYMIYGIWYMICDKWYIYIYMIYINIYIHMYNMMIYGSRTVSKNWLMVSKQATHIQKFRNLSISQILPPSTKPMWPPPTWWLLVAQPPAKCPNSGHARWCTKHLTKHGLQHLSIDSTKTWNDNISQ